MTDVVYKNETVLGQIEKRMSDAVSDTETAQYSFSIPVGTNINVLKAMEKNTQAVT